MPTRSTDGAARERVTGLLDGGRGVRPVGSASFAGETRWSAAPGADREEFPVVAFRTSR